MSYIKGKYKTSIFEATSGYKVGLFKVQETDDKEIEENKTLTFTGYFTELNNEDTYILYGNYIFHDRYGYQFSVTNYEKVMPTGKDAIIDFLSSSYVKGCGEATAKSIYKVFKDETLNKIKESKMSSKFDNYHLDMLIEKYNELDKEIGDLRKLINDVAVDHAINESENIASTPTYTGITMQEVKEYIQECVAPAIQSWIVEEYSPEVQNWIVEEYSPEVQNWIVEDVAPEIQNWIVEDYSPEIQNWIVEEYTPMVDSWVAEELKPDFEDTIKESLSDTKANKLSSIDQVLNLLETRKDTKNDNKMITETKEDKYANEYIVKHMPEEYAPHWNLASDVVKESLVSKSRLYDFSKDGVLESFWEKADFTEPIAQVNEGKQKTISFGGEDYIRRSLRATGARLGLRD